MATLAQKRNTPKKVFSFRWHGFNRKGQKVSGEFQADSINTVKAELRKQGVNVTRVSKQGQGMFSKGGARIKPMDIAVISRQITTMLPPVCHWCRACRSSPAVMKRRRCANS